MNRKVDPNKQAAKWPVVTIGERIQACKSMLSIHGFLTDAEAERVQKRIDDWKRQEAAK